MANYIKNLEPRLRTLFLKFGENADSPISQEDYVLLQDYSNIIFKKHFSLHKQHHEDLIQEGVIGVYNLLKTQTYIEGKSAANFAFTKIRNCMTNYLYKIKESPSDDAFILDNAVCRTSLNNLSRFNASYQVTTVVKNLPVSNEVKSYLYYYYLYDILPPDQLLDLVSDTVISMNESDYKLLPICINLTEYLLMVDIDKDYFENPIKDIFKLYKADNPEMSEILSTLPSDLAEKVVLCFSKLVLNFPDKHLLKDYDDYISIYYLHVDNKLTVSELSFKFSKPELEINKIIALCTNLYSEQ